MSAHQAPPAASKPTSAAPAKEAYVELAARIYVNLSARGYGQRPASDQKKPDPKALAAFCFKLADAFEQATNETPRKMAENLARDKAAVKLDEVDVSSFIKK